MVPVTSPPAVVVLVELLEADGTSPAMVLVVRLLVVGGEPPIEGVVVPGDVGGGVVGPLVSSVVGRGDVVVGGEDVLVADVTDVVLGVVVVLGVSVVLGVVVVVVVEVVTLVEVTEELLVVGVGVTSNVVWVHIAA